MSASTFTDRNRKRKNCDKCKQSYTRGHFKRHKCLSDDGLESIASSSAQIVLEQVLPLMKPDDHDELDFDFVTENVTTHQDEEKCDVDDDFDECLLHNNDIDDDEIVDSDDSDFKEDETETIDTSVPSWICLFLVLWQSTFKIPDAALKCLLKFMHVVFSCVMSCADLLPKTLYMLRKCMSCSTAVLRKYVVCKKCFKLYKLEDCTYTRAGKQFARQCKHVLYPRHTKRHLRRPCNTDLVERIMIDGKETFRPIKQYVYTSLKDCLYAFVNRPKYEEQCELWRNRVTDENFLTDIYDGNIWKRMEAMGFCKERQYNLMLNVDWFQPYKHVNYSVGAIYLVNLNLPRAVRFKTENVILVGILPPFAGKEPPLNSFLEPLIDELLTAWTTGFHMTTFESRNEEVVNLKLFYCNLITIIYIINFQCFKLALICINCDLPACRKACGFLSHAANRGCSRCMKFFPG